MEPVMWICLVPGPAPADAEMRIRAWTADRKRMESLRAEGLDMQPLYRAAPRSALEALMKIAHYSPASTVQPVAIARDALIRIVGTWGQGALDEAPERGS
jgi:hypothetical protein